MKSIVVLLALFIIPIVSFSSQANDKLDQLLKERKTLYKNFEFYQKQKSSFWGTQSKKDLRKAVDVLKKIIVKDSEIINQINIKHSQRNVQVISKNQVSQDYASELEYENNKLKLLLNKMTFDFNQLSSETDQMYSSTRINNTVIFVLILILSGLIFYTLKLKKALKLRDENYSVGGVSDSIASSRSMASSNAM